MRVINKQSILILLLIYLLVGFIIFTFIFSLVPTPNDEVKLIINPTSLMDLWTSKLFWVIVLQWPIQLTNLIF